jgi:hypothetical protein
MGHQSNGSAKNLIADWLIIAGQWFKQEPATSSGSYDQDKSDDTNIKTFIRK